MKSNKSFFWIGVGLSPFILLFFWLLENKPKPVAHLDVAPKKTLFSIDFIPVKEKKQVPNKEFLLLPDDASLAPIVKKIAEFSGKPIIIHFWATWCGACVDEIPQLDKFAAENKDKFHFLVVASDQTQGQAVREFYRKHNIKNLTLYIEDEGKLARGLRITALPTSVFVNSKGRELGRIVGPVEWMDEAGKILDSYLSKSK